MIFDKNQTVFPSEFQKNVWVLGRAVLPLDITLPGIIDAEMREGCIQIYRFTQELLEDMYNNPNKYNERSPAVCLVYLLDWCVKEGAFLDENGFEWILPPEKADKIMSKSGLSLLEPLGFLFSIKNEHTFIKNDNYPLLLKYWYKLYRLGPKGSAVRLRNLQACDFRLFSKAKRQTIEDLLNLVSAPDHVCIKELHEYVMAKGAKKESGSYKYTYKKEPMVTFDQKPCVLISFRLETSDSLSSYISIINTQPDKKQLVSFIENKTECCISCGHKLCKKGADVFICFPCGSRTGIEYRHAGITDVLGVKLQPGCRYDINKGNKENKNYSNEDIKMLKRMLDIRFAQIDNQSRG
ncbi:MAG: hypothetical protein FWD16_02450 [Clostridia bacterium]|nr:hypothetical protein [Clostridia bacterium]